MKIERLRIENYRQFKDLQLDLTYPRGHEKAGAPLDKVCIIGQSGTGKTTLIETIRDIILDETGTPVPSYPAESEIIFDAVMGPLGKSVAHPSFSDIQEELSGPGLRKSSDEELQKDYRQNKLPHFIYLPTGDLTPKSDQKETKEAPLPSQEQLREARKLLRKKAVEEAGYDFSKREPKELWDLILAHYRDYDTELEEHLRKIGRKAIANAGELPTDLKSAFDEWHQHNQNPLEALAKSIAPILKRFHVEIKTQLDSSKEREFIPIQTLDGKLVPLDGWSTGTKQIIMTAAPLHFLNTKYTVVLIDEPERSLYPDVQYEIVDFYQKIAPGSQQFFATHSPIIASAFEPWEIVELAFNPDGSVSQVPYWQKMRHMDYYTKDPRYLRWDSILHRLFNLEEEGNELREDAMMQLAQLNLKIKRLIKQPDRNEKEFKTLTDQYRDLAAKLDWEIGTETRHEKD